MSPTSLHARCMPIAAGISLCIVTFCAANPTGTVPAPALRIVEAARTQVGQTVLYDPSYQRLAYPDGDVPPDRGVCTDVVIRALRVSLKLDLQKAVHEDMKNHFAAYPKNWGLKSTDRNIDHRRVPNLQTFFKRQGWSLPVSQSPGDYRPGDLVTCIVPPNLPHIMIVSDKRSGEGRPWVLHNIGAGAREEDRLFEFKLTGHYRIGERHANSSTSAPPADVAAVSPAPQMPGGKLRKSTAPAASLR